MCKDSQVRIIIVSERSGINNWDLKLKQRTMQINVYYLYLIKILIFDNCEVS